ncbi:MAG TPA: SMI1/KNR4 family protein [Sporomusaceae bacterium]|nr:SMI1/KNR4 family protein [Sporomusaceae bacterium]
MEFKRYVAKMDLNSPGTENRIEEVQMGLGIRFPIEYINFMLNSNGAEGFVSESYLAIWPLEKLISLNEEYAVKEFTPELVYFGSDGGGLAYAFDISRPIISIVEFPFESIRIEDAKFCGNTFIEFLDCLYHKSNP